MAPITVYILLAVFVISTAFLIFFSVKAVKTINGLRERNKKYSYFLDQIDSTWRHRFSKEL